MLGAQLKAPDIPASLPRTPAGCRAGARAAAARSRSAPMPAPQTASTPAGARARSCARGRRRSAVTTVVPSATPNVMAANTMNAELRRALPEDRWRLASSVIATVIVNPGSSVMMPASVVVGMEMCTPCAATKVTSAEATNDAVSSKTCEVIVKRLNASAIRPMSRPTDRADHHVVVRAAEKSAAGRRHDRVAEHAQPPRVRRLLRQDLVDARGPFLWRLGSVEHGLHDIVERRQAPQIQLAGLHANQVRLLVVQRTERGHDGGRRREELADDAETVADLLEDLFQAVRCVAGLVQRVPQPQHEQRGVALVELWPGHGQRIYDRQVHLLPKQLR